MAAPPSQSASGISALVSAPPQLLRRASSAASESFSTTTSAGGVPGTGERKRRTRNLLQNYKNMAQGGHGGVGSASTNKGDPFDIEIRELDGERQSLVYNHHHELIQASDTIRKMKSRAEALDASLDSLKSAFQSIAQLSDSLAPQTGVNLSSSSLPRSLPPPSTTTIITSSGPHRLDVLSEDPSPPSNFEPLIHLPALLSLPILLKALLVNDRARADSLWGLWEPALRSWEDEEVQGVKEIGMECREALRRGRRGSSSVAKVQAQTS
ncbi:BQ2448_880 [Microbotryum intermedium]|uniref:BQ2448_880 protein n=1 Tax=Microbotryum intermedium TaxID=269621 RepID=A0A238F7M6_9BASI|nr:BQ2448_880 [Microbotryum intermedium]